MAWSYFRQLAAKQLAIFRGLGFAGGYLGGVHAIDDVHTILDLASSFAADWKEFAREIQYPVEGEFYYFAKDDGTTLADPSRLSPAYEASLQDRTASHNVTFGYRFSKWVHDFVFTPGQNIHNWVRSIYAKSRNPEQGPPLLRVIEHASKSAMFRCKDCGDCSLTGHRLSLPRVAVCEEPAERPLRRHSRWTLRGRRFRVHLEPGLRPLEVRGSRAVAARATFP